MATERIDYDRGYVVLDLNKTQHCTSWLLLPAENLWHEALRGVLYILALAFFFIGIAIASDVFMCSIEVITSKKRKVIRWDEERQEKVEREVLLWNETVANLTLMALGSSAPEILLATGEMLGDLDSREAKDALGTFTIIGSAAFNLLIITAVCILSVPTGEVKSIKELGVFIVTSIWSIWAYIWMLLVVRYITPEQIDPWEAWLTLGFLPLFVLMSYLTDRGWCCSKRRVEGIETFDEENDVPVRVIGHQHQMFTRSVGKELRVLEAEKAHRMSVVSLRSDSEKMMRTGSECTTSRDSMGSHENYLRKTAHGRQSHIVARARFRHAAVSAFMGSRNLNVPPEKGPRMADIITKVKHISDAIKHGHDPEADILGKFTFASDRFAVLDSAGIIEIDILFHRQMPSGSVMHSIAEEDKSTCIDGKGILLTTTDPSGASQRLSAVSDVLSVDYETREGTAKAGVDFIYTQGTLTYTDKEYSKLIEVPIVSGNHFQADKDFYIILKNATGKSGLGDPSITRVTIVNDNEPGEFLFAEPHYYADMRSGQAMVSIIREHGFDGKVTLEYSTIDGTAIGGNSLEAGVDFVESHGQVVFEHGETSKAISIEINRNSQTPKNFIIAIRNPSVGAKVGIRSAVVVHLNKDDLMERVGEVLEDEEEEHVTWSGQFVQAMTVASSKDEDGVEIPPTCITYFMHFLTFFWKVFCAAIPPTSMWGAWPSFFVSLLFLGMMTTVVEQLGKLLGCVVGLETSVAGITIIALGTSLPDTFASRTAAIQDEHADAAIGNITGSNSVNVFLGLGLPWVIKTMHALIHGYTFKVKTDNLAQSVLVFGVAGTACILTLIFRRLVLGGELGSRTWVDKALTATFLLGLWLVYAVVCSMQAYGYISI